MANETLDLFQEIKPHRDKLGDVHPLKLDRWHRGLVGLPDPIYMQLGCSDLVQQLHTSVKVLEQLIQVLGADNLPVKPQELSRRKIGKFRWYVQDGEGAVCCYVLWEAKDSTWKLQTDRHGPSTTKLIATFDEVVDTAVAWIREKGVEGTEDPHAEEA